MPHSKKTSQNFPLNCLLQLSTQTCSLPCLTCSQTTGSCGWELESSVQQCIGLAFFDPCGSIARRSVRWEHFLWEHPISVRMITKIAQFTCAKTQHMRVWPIDDMPSPTKSISHVWHNAASFREIQIPQDPKSVGAVVPITSQQQQPFFSQKKEINRTTEQKQELPQKTEHRLFPKYTRDRSKATSTKARGRKCYLPHCQQRQCLCC